MFNINKLTLINFRSYKGTHAFEFPCDNGLYYFTGKNLLEPTLGANGSGKSTFLDAITWVLYGRTTRGLKASEVLSWHTTTGAQVIIELTVGKQRHTVKRTQKPNNLLIDGKPVDQKELETFIRLNYAGFTHSVMSPQFGEPFFSMGASEKLTLFSDFMNLNLWLVKSELASAYAKVLETEIDKLQTSITRGEGQVELMKADIAALKEQKAGFEAERKDKLGALSVEAADTFKALKKLGKEIAGLEKELGQCEAEQAVLLDWALKATAKRDATLETLQMHSRQRTAAETDRNRLEHELMLMRKMADTTCSRCRQKVSGKHIAQEAASFKDRIDDLSTIVNLEKEAGQRVAAKLVEAKAKVESTTQQVNDMADDISTLKQKIAVKKSKAGALDDLLDRIAIDVSKIEHNINPFEALLGEKNTLLADINRRLVEDKQRSNERVAKADGCTFWAKGFKRIRLFIIERAFETLELEVNNCLAQLGMTDWQVSFDVERENKSGGITKGFVVLIKGPSNKTPVKWENWSGGETQRLQLAGDLGLANLIMQQAELRNEFEVFDEPSTHLSPEGMMDLADTLHERAISEGKRIWIVDHAAITNFGDFQGIITARKDENGSNISGP